MASFAPLTFAPLDRHSDESAAAPHGSCGRPPVLMDLAAAASSCQEKDAEPAHSTPEPPSFTQADLDAAAAAAREATVRETEERVRAEVVAEVENRLEHSLALAVERCARELATLNASTAAADRRAEDDAALAMAISRAIVPHALACAPLADVEAMLIELLRGLQAEPRLELKLAPPLVDRGRRLALDLAKRAGFAGEMVVSADAGLEPGDARLVWRDGQAERCIEHIVAEVEDMVAVLKDGRTPEGSENDEPGSAGATP